MRIDPTGYVWITVSAQGGAQGAGPVMTSAQEDAQHVLLSGKGQAVVGQVDGDAHGADEWVAGGRDVSRVGQSVRQGVPQWGAKGLAHLEQSAREGDLDLSGRGFLLGGADRGGRVGDVPGGLGQDARPPWHRLRHSRPRRVRRTRVRRGGRYAGRAAPATWRRDRTSPPRELRDPGVGDEGWTKDDDHGGVV